MVETSFAVKNRVAIGHHHHRGEKPRLGGDAGEMSHQRQRLQMIAGPGVDLELARLRIGVARADRLRHDDMIRDREEAIAELLAPLGDRGDVGGGRQRSGNRGTLKPYPIDRCSLRLCRVSSTVIWARDPRRHPAASVYPSRAAPRSASRAALAPAAESLPIPLLIPREGASRNPRRSPWPPESGYLPWKGIG